MVTDARSNTRTWIKTYYISANAVDDDGNALGMECMYENPEYPMTRELKAPSVVDGIITIKQPNSQPLMDPVTKVPYGYREKVGGGIYAVNKTGVTATKAIWQIQKEMRRIAEEHPLGSTRSFLNFSPADKVLGSTTLYGCEWELDYQRGTT